MQKGIYKKFVVGALQTNSYIISTKNGHIICDPGDVDYITTMEKNNIYPIAIILTHCHGDHSAGINNIQKKYDIPVYISEDEWDFFNMGGSFSEILNVPEVKIKNEHILKGDSGKFTIDDIIFKYEVFPGHTPGATIFQLGNTIFTGDLVFDTSIGRSDLFGGDAYEMVESLKRFFNEYKENYYLCPGHMGEISIKEILKKNNVLIEVLNDKILP
ncbi:MBL fold metallo-hydrolase [bacterium]|nr:MBL fold metallo-hydrolase [bacterium]